jgi:hypothetical protein
MRRLMAIAAFALFLAVPLWAQHGGGGGHAGGFGGGHMGGFAGHSGFSGGHGGFGGGHVAGGRSFVGRSGGGMRSPGVSRGFSRVPSSRFLSSRAGFSREPFLHDRFRDQDRFRGSRFRDHDRDRRFRDFGFRNNCRGFGCGWPWWYAGYWDPWWWWNSDSDYDQSYNDNLALAQQMNEQNLEEQRMLRQEEADGDQDDYAHSDPAPRPAVNEEKTGTPIVPATVLVFRDQHRQEVDNYAIVGQTLWVFAPKQAGRIALADLDVAATVKANEDRGVTFRLPVTNEAQ